jgi:hypothetical protein
MLCLGDTPAPAAPAPGAVAQDPSAQDPVTAIMSKLTGQMKQLAMEQAAINTAISISLAVIPVVGWAVDIVFSVASALMGNYYSNQVKTLIANFQNELTLDGAQYQQQIQQAQNAAVTAETPAGIQLALSGQVTATSSTPPAGTAGLGKWEDIIAKIAHFLGNPLQQLHPLLRIGHVVFTDVNDVAARSGVPAIASLANSLNHSGDTIYNDTLRAQAAISQVISQSTGQAQVQKVQDAITQARAAALSQFQTQTATAIDNINSPPYRAQLRITIAQQVLKDPSTAALVAQELNASAITPISATGYTPPSKATLVVPAIGAAAALLVVAHLKNSS